ncbi:MAG: hypothetical protein V7K64_01145 [Nostoc sp.]|uniref:hypothetical protein n=1 Tax=unclassified Nostoc TaxID=2593658 RepID=UPI001DBFBBC4|nr:hypothetical protein [Nostoc sp. JL34]MBN3884369.1 hypothetical protein [Nostoc sp. JL34]
MNLSLPASLWETEREEQRKIQLFAPLSVSDRSNKTCRTHVLLELLKPVPGLEAIALNLLS